jgi:hypothetical protein
VSGRPDLARRQFLRDARDTIPAAAPVALIEHAEVVP